MTTFTEANRKAFDDLSSTYNTQPWQLALSAQITEALRARVDWISPVLLNPETRHLEENEDQEVKLLDFASGTGNASKALAPYVTSIRGIDISPQMVSAYNTASQGSGFFALQGDLFAKEGPPAHLTTPEFSEFDVAVIALGFHHFEDPKLALERLAERLKAITGVLVIVDFLPFSPSSSSSATVTADDGGDKREGIESTIKHHGFTPEKLQDLFTSTGFVDFEISALKAPALMKHKSTGEMTQRTIFIAKGRKAGSVLQRIGAWVGGMQDSIGGQIGVPKRDEGEGWNPGAITQEGRGVGWNMVPDVASGAGERVEREETRGWNGFR